MSAFAPPASGIYAEIWRSFASLLASYTALHGLPTRREAEIQSDAERILVRMDERFLRLSRQEERGVLRYDNGITAAFTLHDDGSITIDGQTEAIDLAAERLAREIMR